MNKIVMLIILCSMHCFGNYFGYLEVSKQYKEGEYIKLKKNQIVYNDKIFFKEILLHPDKEEEIYQQITQKNENENIYPKNLFITINYKDRKAKILSVETIFNKKIILIEVPTL